MKDTSLITELMFDAILCSNLPELQEQAHVLIYLHGHIKRVNLLVFNFQILFYFPYVTNQTQI